MPYRYVGVVSISHVYTMKWLSNWFSRMRIAFKTALKTFIAQNYFRYSASLSFYTVFSLAPLIIVTISMCGYFFGRHSMEGKIFSEIRAIVGDAVGTQIQLM